MKILSILVLFFAVLNSNAQPFGSLEQLKTRFPDQPIVYILKDENIDIKNDKAGLVIIKHVKEQMMIMNESAKNFKTRSVFASSFIEIKNIKAFNYIKNGNKYTKTLIDNIKVNDSNSDGVFYDGSKKLTITYNNSEPGSVFELEYDEVYLEPRFFGSFYLTENYPVIKANCTINCPNSVKLNIKNFNLTNLKIKSTEKPAKNSIIYNWTIDSLKEYKYEEYGPDYRSLAGYKLFNIEEYTKDGTTIPLVGTVNNLYKWYRGLVKNLNKTPSPHLKMITDSLIANCKTDVEKIKKIYYWVQDKISYVAYEDGLGGFVPREADIIMKRRFGDCKDMASILTAMGKAAGLPIYLTWIGTTDIPYQFTEVPAPMAANHMIAAYVTKDTCLFLDATGKFQDLGVHTSFIQGKEAIIGISENEYIIKKVPYIPHTKTYVMDSVSLKIQDNLLVGNGYLKFDGYKKVHIQTQINGKSYTELYDYFKSYCEKGNNKFKLDTVIISKNERDVPVEIKYTFKIPNYITTLTNEIFMNLNFDKNYFEDFSTQDRKNGFEFLYAFDKQLLVTLALDKKYSVNFIPENSFYTNSNFGCQSSYTKTPSQLIFKSTIHINSTFVNYNEFEKWNEFLKEHNKNNNKSISLNKLQ